MNALFVRVNLLPALGYLDNRMHLENRYVERSHVSFKITATVETMATLEFSPRDPSHRKAWRPCLSTTNEST